MGFMGFCTHIYVRRPCFCSPVFVYDCKGSFPTSDLVPGPTPTLSSGAEVVISLNPTMFNNATVLMADIAACNGFINTIDTVLTFLPTGKFQ